MLGSLVKHWLRSRHGAQAPPATTTPLRLHIGGKEPHPDWKIVNILPGEHVDYVRSCTDLSLFPTGSVAEIYASHVLEHLGYKRDLPAALREIHRVLVPGGMLRASVPDLTMLCETFADPALSDADRLWVMRVIYGGQLDAADFHYVGLYEGLMTTLLSQAGFAQVERVGFFGIFADASSLVFRGRPVSLNVIARKAPDKEDDEAET